MDWIVERLSQQALDPDEFTVEMVMEKTKATSSAIRSNLQRMRNAGEVTTRKITLNGVVVNVYKRVST
jgi:hypothetical protein